MAFRVTRDVVVPVIAVFAALGSSASTSNGTLQVSTCNQPDCLRCNLDTAECLKCLYVMMEDDRTCLESCPEGFSMTWSYANNYVGRVCTARSLLSFVSGRDVAIIAGAAVGGAICVGVVIGALLYMRRRTKQTTAAVDAGRTSRAPRIWRDKRLSATEVEVDDVERSAFLEQLSSLEGETHNFVEMLNETRDRFRKLGGADSTTDTKAKAYRAVLRDLSRILSLLTRSEGRPRTVPADWRRLVAWATRVLARYKRQKAARAAGEIPSIEPLSPAGGTLYQTRRQLQEERRRQAAAQGLPCCLHGRCQGSGGTVVHDIDTEGSDSGCSGDFKGHLCPMGSRSASRLSLGPVIFEEDEDEVEREDYSLDSSKDDQSSCSHSTEDEVQSEETEESELKESDIGEGEEEEKALEEDEEEIGWVYDLAKIQKDANDNVPGFSTKNGQQKRDYTKNDHQQRDYIIKNNYKNSNNHHSSPLFDNNHSTTSPSNLMMNLKNVMNLTIGDGESNFFSALESHVAKPRPCPPRRNANIMFENEKAQNNKNNKKNINGRNKRNAVINQKLAKQQRNLQRQKPVQTKRQKNMRVARPGSLDTPGDATDAAPCVDEARLHTTVSTSINASTSTNTSTKNPATAYDTPQTQVTSSLTHTSNNTSNITNNNSSTDSSGRTVPAPEDLYLGVTRNHTPTTGFRVTRDPFRDDTLDDCKNNNLVLESSSKQDPSSNPSNTSTTPCSNSDNRSVVCSSSLVRGKTQGYTGVADFARTLLLTKASTSREDEYLPVPRCELTTDL